MSASAPALAPPRRSTPGRDWSPPVTERPLLRVGAFTGLALFGAVRWGTLMSPAPTARLLGLVALAVALVVAGPWLAARSRAGAVALAIIVALAMLHVSGMPWSWIRHVRITVTARAVGNGIDALPRLFVPYRGANHWVRMVFNLGAAVLLYDAALMLAFAGRPLRRRRGGADAGSGRRDGAGGDLRRAIAALPLIALAVVPLTMVPARFQYAEGAVLFMLLAALVWGERLPHRGTGTAALICALACAAAMVAAPALDTHTPWIHYQTLAAGVKLEAQEDFNWSQSYSSLNWPRDGRLVLEVGATHGDYWKAVNLETFDGRGWSQGVSDTTSVGPSQGPEDVSASARARWTQTVSVVIGAMTTMDVIGPGETEAPTHLGVNTFTEGLGRWMTYAPLGPGDTYQVRAYSPHPSAAQLAAAGTNYPESIVPTDLVVNLPPVPGLGATPMVWVDAYGAPAPHIVQTPFGGVSGVALLQQSPYARVYALAQRLRAASPTPYAYVKSVLALLSHGYTYDEHPRERPYPLASFLFTDKRGYCQQFAGAMALLLRLGGVPARVAAGFTAGQYDRTHHSWLVSDYDAHAWVEAFFPGYGWVRFDPTPASSDPAQQPQVHLGSLLAGSSLQTPATKQTTTAHGLNVPGSTGSASARHHRHGGSMSLLAPSLIVLAVLAALALFATRPVRNPSPERMLAELERAFARSGRALAPDLTLTELERRMAGVPDAAGYVQAISAARFGAADAGPSGVQRRALRGQLSAGLGLSGRIRALWAMPPRRSGSLGRRLAAIARARPRRPLH